ncbi:MAG: hypothetical protein NTZ56_07805 [Acidobacteria bacterium]|nr:hypothetical protein [Acidobacteriota bacterium]
MSMTATARKANPDGLLREVHDYLDTFRASVDARSCTAYVRDPFWPDEYRLVAMPGVAHREPMYGFMFPKESSARLRGKEDFQVVVTPEAERIGPPGLKSEIRELFGGFACREKVEQYVQLRHFDANGWPEVVLFINFETRRVFPPEEEAKMRNALRKGCRPSTRVRFGPACP